MRLCYAECMRSTVALSAPILQNAKLRAKARNVTLSVVIEDALRAHLSDAPNVEIDFKLHTVRGKLVNPNLDLDRTSAILIADDESSYACNSQT